MVQSLSPPALGLGLAGVVSAVLLALGYLRAFRHGDSRLVRLVAPVGLLVLIVSVVGGAVSAFVLPLFPLVVLAPAPVAEACRRAASRRPFASLLVYVAGGVLVLYGSLIALLYERTLGGSSTSLPFVVLATGGVLAAAGAVDLWRLASVAAHAPGERIS